MGEKGKKIRKWLFFVAIVGLLLVILVFVFLSYYLEAIKTTNEEDSRKQAVEICDDLRTNTEVKSCDIDNDDQLITLIIESTTSSNTFYCSRIAELRHNRDWAFTDAWEMKVYNINEVEIDSCDLKKPIVSVFGGY